MARILALVLERRGRGDISGEAGDGQSEAEGERRGTLSKRQADEKMTAAAVETEERFNGHQTGTFEPRQEGEESTGVCEECGSGRRQSGSAAEVEPECFYFLHLAVGERDFQAVEFS